MILAVNPGSTSTKIAVFEFKTELFQSVIRHSSQELNLFPSIRDQLPFRINLVMEQLEVAGISLAEVGIVIGRGGLVRPLASGVYRVNDLMREHLASGFQGQHASNLGGLIADLIAQNCPHPVIACIADPVVVDELQPVARISGHPLFRRNSVFHALNQKAVARKYACSVGKDYRDLNLIIAHLGGGISVGAHQNGQVVDVNQALDGDGPFSPERSGSLPAGQLVDLCFDGRYTQAQVRSMICGKGGLVAYCDSNDVQQSVGKAINGDAHTELIIKAMCYQVAKEIGAMGAVLKGKVDRIILTGGIAYNQWITDMITGYVSYIAPVTLSPGEDEMAALASNAQMVLEGTLPLLDY